MMVDQSHDIVKQEVERTLDALSRHKCWKRRASFWFTISAATLSAISTVAIGLSETFDIKLLLGMALVSSGIATVIGAWEGFFPNRKLMVANNVTIAALEELIESKAKRKEIGEAAYKKVKKDFNLKKTTKKYVKVLKQIIKEYKPNDDTLRNN